MNEWGKTIKVPIYYSPKEKFVSLIEAFADHDQTAEYQWGLPRFGFELVDIAYDNQRMLNPLSRINDTKAEQQRYMFNRVPYTYTFTLYLAVRKFEDGLKIIEQIVPFFTPDLNITIKDKSDFGISTDIPVILNSLTFTIEYQGTFETVRTITWQFNFMVKGFLYSNIREQKRIKETIINMTDADFDSVYSALTSEVEPRIAQRNDDYEIVDTLYNGPAPVKFTIDLHDENISIVDDIDSEEPYTVLHLMPIRTGELVWIVDVMRSNTIGPDELIIRPNETGENSELNE